MIRSPRFVLAAAIAAAVAAPALAQDARDESNQAPAHRALGVGDTNSLQHSPKLQVPPRALAGHSTSTRDEVRQDLQAAREAGAVTPDGNIGDTPRTLMAREQYAEQQGAIAQAELDRRAAMDAAAAAPQPAPAPVAPFGAGDSVNLQSPAADPPAIQR